MDGAKTTQLLNFLNPCLFQKLRQEKCDDAKELRNIYEKFAVALTSLVQFVRAQINELGVPGIANINPVSRPS